MPCYLFTYHTYRTWMPDRRQGYVRRGRGILPADVQMAKVYRKNARHDMVQFHADHQRAAINTLRDAVDHIVCRLHLVATDSTHIHVLVSWNDKRTWERNRTSLKRALTISLKEQCGSRPWLSEGASRKRVRDRAHFDYLVTRYMPSHSGWKWCEQRGLFK